MVKEEPYGSFFVPKFREEVVLTLHKKQTVWSITDIIREYADFIEDNDIHVNENMKAKKALIKYYYSLRDLTPIKNFTNSCSIPAELEGVMEYLAPIFQAYLALKRQNYCLAAWELTGIYPELVLENRYYYNILYILNKGLNIDV